MLLPALARRHAFRKCVRQLWTRNSHPFDQVEAPIDVDAESEAFRDRSPSRGNFQSPTVPVATMAVEDNAEAGRQESHFGIKLCHDFHL